MNTFFGQAANTLTKKPMFELVLFSNLDEDYAVQNDRTEYGIISWFCKKTHFKMVFTSQISVFRVTPYFRFSCITNSFHKDLISCILGRDSSCIFERDRYPWIPWISMDIQGDIQEPRELQKAYFS